MASLLYKILQNKQVKSHTNFYLMEEVFFLPKPYQSIPNFVHLHCTYFFKSHMYNIGLTQIYTNYFQ